MVVLFEFIFSLLQKCLWLNSPKNSLHKGQAQTSLGEKQNSSAMEGQRLWQCQGQRQREDKIRKVLLKGSFCDSQR